MSEMWRDDAVSLYAISTEDHIKFFQGLVNQNADYNMIYDRQRAAAN